MNTRFLVASLVGFLFLSTPETAVANNSCENGICEVVFEYTGSAQQWTVPDGIASFEFQIYGASGGRGGLGGSVAGSLSQLPTTVWIFVGGAGSEGKTALGGFNGGGQAGGNRGNEGSGGGASDIRLGQSLNDRILVAGGGGGAGGFKGAAGGSGGGLIGSAGATGQGGGGGGGSQTQGGSRGTSLGGSQPSAGAFGIGGSGGVSWNAGGGGGGGGWYGGGGGGADDDTCCSDGGGGGGGSSYANSSYASNITHQQGVRSGHGLVVIRYALPIEILSMSVEQISSTSAELVVSANRIIEGLTFSDFVIAGQGCAFESINLSANSARGLLNSCSNGITTITLLANSIGSLGPGPLAPVSRQLLFDRLGPTFSWLTVSNVYSNSPILLPFSVSDNLTLTTESFSISSCSIAVRESAVELTSCSQGVISARVTQGTLSDNWGNTGPQNQENIEFVFDSVKPMSTFEKISHSGEVVFTFSTILRFSEPVTFSMPSVLFSSDVPCETKDEVMSDGWHFWATCGYAEVSWQIIADKIFDLHGNSAEFESGSISFKLSKPIAVSTESIPVPSQQTGDAPTQTAQDSNSEPPQIVDLPNSEPDESALQADESSSPLVEVGDPEVTEGLESDPVTSEQVASEVIASWPAAETRERSTSEVGSLKTETDFNDVEVAADKLGIALEKPSLVFDSVEPSVSQEFPLIVFFAAFVGFLALGFGLIRISGR